MRIVFSYSVVHSVSDHPKCFAFICRLREGVAYYSQTTRVSSMNTSHIQTSAYSRIAYKLQVTIRVTPRCRTGSPNYESIDLCNVLWASPCDDISFKRKYKGLNGENIRFSRYNFGSINIAYLVVCLLCVFFWFRVNLGPFHEVSVPTAVTWQRAIESKRYLFWKNKNKGFHFTVGIAYSFPHTNRWAWLSMNVRRTL